MQTKSKLERSTASAAMRIATALALALPATGCLMGPNYERPEVPVAQDFRAQSGPAEARSIADMAWWDVFDDPALQSLIGEAMQNNNDLDIAVARVAQARALTGVARSQALPHVGYEIVGGTEDTYVLGPNNSLDSVDYETYGGLLTAAWEVDLWGRIRRETEAAKARMMAEEYSRRGVMLTLASDLAAGYFRLLRLDRELAIAEESERAYRDTFDLFSVRFELGRDSKLPVERAQAAFNSSTARIADLRREIEQQENALSVLVGSTPRSITRGRPLGEQMTPEAPPGLTTDLLKRRPDILQAEQSMIAANAEIGAAVANFFPRIGLAAIAGEHNVSVGGVDDSFAVTNIFGTIAGPIFNGGRYQSEYEARKAFWDESIAQYRRTVLVAFQETSNALVAQGTLMGRRAALERQVGALRSSVEYALLRYRSGRSSYFEVLEAQQQLFPAEYELAQTQEAQLVATVSLYKALGGGWNLSDEAWTRRAAATPGDDATMER